MRMSYRIPHSQAEWYEVPVATMQGVVRLSLHYHSL